MATLKLPFALEKPSESVGVCDVTEIWDSVNSQWLNVTVTGGGGATYTAGDGISISSGNVISVAAATSSAYGGVKLGVTSTETNRAVLLDGNGKAYVALQAATNAAKGTVQLSDSTNIATDLTNQNDTKAVTPKAVSTAIENSVRQAAENAVDARIWVGTKVQYDAIVTKDPDVLYFVTY
jgi:hypothetical protein